MRPVNVQRCESLCSWYVRRVKQIPAKKVDFKGEKWTRSVNDARGGTCDLDRGKIVASGLRYVM